MKVSLFFPGQRVGPPVDSLSLPFFEKGFFFSLDREGLVLPSPDLHKMFPKTPPHLLSSPPKNKPSPPFPVFFFPPYSEEQIGLFPFFPRMSSLRSVEVTRFSHPPQGSFLSILTFSLRISSLPFSPPYPEIKHPCLPHVRCGTPRHPPFPNEKQQVTPPYPPFTQKHPDRGVFRVFPRPFPIYNVPPHRVLLPLLPFLVTVQYSLSGKKSGERFPSLSVSSSQLRNDHLSSPAWSLNLGFFFFFSAIPLLPFPHRHGSSLFPPPFLDFFSLGRLSPDRWPAAPPILKSIHTWCGVLPKDEFGRFFCPPTFLSGGFPLFELSPRSTTPLAGLKPPSCPPFPPLPPPAPPPKEIRFFGLFAVLPPA